MMDSEASRIMDALLTLTEDMLRRTVDLNARCDSLEAVVSILALRSGLDQALIGDMLKKTYNQFYSERLLEIERTNPGVAGRIDRREKHEEGLSDTEKFLRFDRPEDDRPQG